MECPKCQSKNVSEDFTRSEMICDDCQAIVVISNNNKDTEFEEMANGRVVAVGNIIHIGDQANKQVTLNKSRSKIQNLCNQLCLSEKIASYSFSIYKTALLKGITRGRKSCITIGACVYLACRIKNESLMLLDVSDKINVNVYVLGKTYVELKEKTGQNVPDIDPCLFIDRFAASMELGDQIEPISARALKLLQRMKKDWISTGRRPTGITAAALLVSARIAGFDRNYDDLAHICGVSSHTIKKRIQEWARTGTAGLTLSEFEAIEYEDEEDPPAFKADEVELSVEDEDEIVKRRELAAAEVREIQLALKAEGEGEDMDQYERLAQGLEAGLGDVQALIGAVKEDYEDEDGRHEMEGRMALLGRCAGLEVLGKKEDHSLCEQELPIYLEGLTNQDGDADSIEDVEDSMSDGELERVYIVPREEAVMNLKLFVRAHPDYYRKEKRSAERRMLRRRKMEESEAAASGGARRAKKRRAVEGYEVDTEELLRELKGGGGGFKYEEAQEPIMDVKEGLDEDREEEEEEEIEQIYNYDE